MGLDPQTALAHGAVAQTTVAQPGSSAALEADGIPSVCMSGMVSRWFWEGTRFDPRSLAQGMPRTSSAGSCRGAEAGGLGGLRGGRPRYGSASPPGAGRRAPSSSPEPERGLPAAPGPHKAARGPASAPPVRPQPRRPWSRLRRLRSSRRARARTRSPPPAAPSPPTCRPAPVLSPTTRSSCAPCPGSSWWPRLWVTRGGGRGGAGEARPGTRPGWSEGLRCSPQCIAQDPRPQVERGERTSPRKQELLYGHTGLAWSLERQRRAHAVWSVQPPVVSAVPSRPVAERWVLADRALSFGDISVTILVVYALRFIAHEWSWCES